MDVASADMTLLLWLWFRTRTSLAQKGSAKETPGRAPRLWLAPRNQRENVRTRARRPHDPDAALHQLGAAQSDELPAVDRDHAVDRVGREVSGDTTVLSAPTPLSNAYSSTTPSSADSCSTSHCGSPLLVACGVSRTAVASASVGRRLLYSARCSPMAPRSSSDSHADWNDSPI